MKKINIFQTALLIIILILSFVVRLYRLNNPIADWHSWRQADTSAVSRNFIKYGFDLRHPRMNNISNVQSGLDNPQGYFFAEFPIYNATQAGLFLLFGHLTIEEWGRIVTNLSSILAILFIYLIAKKHSNFTVAISAAAAYGFIPYNIYYGRVILPDPSMTMAILGAIYFFDLYLDSLKLKNKFRSASLFIIMLIFTTLAFLIKPVALFFTLPFIYLAWKKFGWKLILRWDLYLFLILSVIPLIWWRWWESHYPEGIPAFWWLLNEGNIRFTGAYFWWLFAQRISALILGFWGIVMVVTGFLYTKRKNFGFFLSFVVSSLLYLIVIARGNVQHDYYQIPIVPTLALFFGLGVDTVINITREYSYKIIGYLIVGVCSIFMLAFGWYQVRDYFNINNPAIVAAGQAVDRLTSSNALVIAPYNGDSSFLYQTNRQGWASFETSLEGLIAKGATDYIVVNPSASDLALSKKYKVLAQTNDYILFDLKNKP